jgi:hypothetical protein
MEAVRGTENSEIRIRGQCGEPIAHLPSKPTPNTCESAATGIAPTLAVDRALDAATEGANRTPVKPESSWLAPAVRVETTVRETFEREAGRRGRAVAFKPDREFDAADTWMFTDGSSTGWHSLVILRPGQDARLVARVVETDTRNVGAEVGGLVSAFEATLPGERVAVVSDFLWSIYYVLGWHVVENTRLLQQVAAARALVDARRPASLRFIHVKGHLRDATALGHWNAIADRLCSLGQPIDAVVPRAALGVPGTRPDVVAALRAK